MKIIIFEKWPALLLLVLVLGFTACDNDENNPPPAGENKYLTGVTTERRFTRQEIINQIDAFAPQLQLPQSPVALLVKDVDVAAITYTTTGVDGNPVEASGIIALPVGTSEYDHLLSVQHGTLDMEDAPSKQLFYYETAPVIKGDIVVMADYLGYGASQTPDRQHPFLHTASTGTACADMIEAAREYLRGKGITETDDRLTLMGYSQGGSATIATLLELEKRGEARRVASVQAGAGVYDLEGTLQTFIASAAGNAPFTDSGYIPYIIRGMAYGERLSLDDAKIYSPQLIAAGGTEIFSTLPLSQWHDELGSSIAGILHPDFFVQGFNGNADILRLMAAVHTNSLVNADASATAVTLYHSRLDDFVPYSNSERMHAHCPGSTLVNLTLPGHAPAAIEFMLRCMGLWEMLSSAEE